MSVLDFLSPGLASDHGDLHPVARSAMERRQHDVAATFEERDGWLVPIAIPGEQERLAAVGIADLSHLTKLEVRPAGKPLAGEGVVWYPISPRRALALFPASSHGAVGEQLGSRRVLDVTAQLAVIAIVGPEASTVLRRLTHLHHFPSGGEVAHITAHVLAWDEGYWIVFAQEYGHYMWDVVVDRAAPLGGGPVGVDAIGRLGVA